MGMLQDESILPQPASKYIPQWFKNTPVELKGFNHNFKKLPDQRTVKSCPSFTDVFRKGYVIPCPFDVWLNLKENGDVDWRTPDDSFKIEIHPNDQFVNHVQSNVRKVFKISNPFRIITPKGWSVLQLPMLYHFNPDFYVPYGIIDTDRHHEINQQIFYTSLDDEILIKKGTPLNYLIPFKRSEELEIELVDYNELHEQISANWFKVFSKFKNGYSK
jgi:hypothetical protein